MVTGDSSALSVNSPAFSFSCTFYAVQTDITPLICTCVGNACSSKTSRNQYTRLSVELSRTSHKTNASRTALHAASSSPLYPSAKLAMVLSWRKLLAAALSFGMDPNGCARSDARLAGV